MFRPDASDVTMKDRDEWNTSFFFYHQSSFFYLSWPAIKHCTHPNVPWIRLCKTHVGCKTRLLGQIDPWISFVVKPNIEKNLGVVYVLWPHCACQATPAIVWNSLWPSDVIWRQGSRSTLAQTMACSLMAPNHYLNQCWLRISEVLWHSPDSNFTEST